MVRPCGSNTDGFNVTKTRARISHPHWSVLKDAIEDLVDMPELLAEIEGPLDRGRIEHRRHVGIGEQQALEVALLGEGSHRVPLHPFVGLLARDALRREFEEYGP